MKKEIYDSLLSLETNDNPVLKRKGQITKILADTVSCFQCIDTKKYWKERDNLPWSALDGRGYYDIMGCVNCNNRGWISCSYTNDCSENRIRIYHKDNHDWKDRLEQLYNKALIEVKFVETPTINESPLKIETEEEKPLFEVCKRITKDYLEKSMDVEIEVGKMIDIVKDAVEAYFGNIFSLVDLCKELKVSFSISDSQSVCVDKLVKIKDNNYLGIKTCTKVSQKEIKTGLFGKKNFAKEYTADIFILKPLNQSAIVKANSIISKINLEMTDDILNEF